MSEAPECEGWSAAFFCHVHHSRASVVTALLPCYDLYASLGTALSCMPGALEECIRVDDEIIGMKIDVSVPANEANELGRTRRVYPDRCTTSHKDEQQA